MYSRTIYSPTGVSHWIVCMCAGAYACAQYACVQSTWCRCACFACISHTWLMSCTCMQLHVDMCNPAHHSPPHTTPACHPQGHAGAHLVIAMHAPWQGDFTAHLALDMHASGLRNFTALLRVTGSGRLLVHHGEEVRGCVCLPQAGAEATQGRSGTGTHSTQCPPQAIP